MDTRVRGRVWQSSPPRKGRRDRRGWSGATWNYEVTLDGVVIASDNTGYWRPMYERCRQVVTAAQFVEAYWPWWFKGFRP